MTTITHEACPCRYAGCRDRHLVGIGKFVQGSGFTLEEADEIVRAVNRARRKTPRAKRLADRVDNVRLRLTEAGTFHRVAFHGNRETGHVLGIWRHGRTGIRTWVSIDGRLGRSLIREARACPA